MKHIVPILIFTMALFVAIASLVGCTPQLERHLPPLEIKLPDLIIDSISYRIIPPNDSIGVPVLADRTFMEFTIKIKNIGDAPIADSFFIANSKTNLELLSDHYSHAERVNQRKRKLNPNDTFEVTVLSSIDSQVNRVRFLIATDVDETSQKIPEALPGIEERDYQNNIYELLIR